MQIREIEAGETALAFAAMRELRTHLADEAEFVHRVNDQQRPEGYRLFGVFDDGDAQALCVAGFRVTHTLFGGLSFYVDDLSTLPEARRRGYAGAMLRHLEELARELGCELFHLDSRVDRFEAHRLYLNAGLDITSHHFGKDLSP